jgi:hypothetical protein
VITNIQAYGLLQTRAQWDSNVKLSLCLANYALCHEDVRESGCIDPRFLDLGTSWRWVAIFTPQPLYPRRNRLPVPIGYEAGRPQSWFGRRGEGEILMLPGLELRPLGRPACNQSLYRLPMGFRRLRYMMWLPCDSVAFRATKLNEVDMEQKVLGVSETSAIVRNDLNAEINGLIRRTACNGQTWTQVGL